MASVPSDLKYTKDHEWAKAEGTVATVGITAFACEQLGDIVYIELPKKGAAVSAGATCGVVESTKAVSDIFSPVSGTVLEVNAQAAEGPEIISADPYGKGWLIRVEMVSPKEYEGMLPAAQYEAQIQGS
jgi:glycine cleavage system H protein